MVKVKEFWSFLCERLDYRIFSGVPCLDLKPLYNQMDSKLMHYIPAVHEKAAFGISIGACMSGAKSGVIVDFNYLNTAVDWLEFCKKNKTHLIVITNDSPKLKIPNVVFDGDYDKLKGTLMRFYKKGSPVIVVLKGDTIK